MFCQKDDLMRGITFEDLITAVQSNEEEISEESIKKNLSEMIYTNFEDACSELKQNMSEIIKQGK